MNISHKDFIKEINERQNKIKDNLVITDEGSSVWTKTDYNISRGCQACKNGSLMAVYTGNKCNIECGYCPQGTTEYKNNQPESEKSTRDMWIDDVKKLVTEQVNKLTAVSFTGGEPFLYLHKIIDIASYIQSNHPEIYMFMYTNGTLATEESLKQLASVGIQEIRFHWGATGFTDELLEKMKIAKKYFKHVNVETPAFPDTYEHLINQGKIHKLIETGIEEINLGEFVIMCPMNWQYIGSSEVYNYTDKDFKCSSPTYSRRVTYDIIDYVVANKLNIIVNDCSNDAKKWQRKSFRKTGIEYCC